KFTFHEASAIKKNLEKVNRTTQTFQDSQPKSCRKLSVLPEEEPTGDDSPPGSRLAIALYPDQQSHSFESYLLPGSGAPQVIRQLSDPTTSRSTRRPLQISTSGCPISEARAAVQDSGLGSEVRIPSPTFTTLQVQQLH
ncbi:unnamed protein product, partial [Nesidiocoris tenuis]